MVNTLAFVENKENSADPHDYCLANFVEECAAHWVGKKKISGLKMINNMSFLISISTKAIITIPFGSVCYHHYHPAPSLSRTHPVLFFPFDRTVDMCSRAGSAMCVYGIGCVNQLRLMWLAWPCSLRPSGAQPPAA